MIILPKPEILNSLLTIQVDDIYFDLHNEYECFALNFDIKGKKLSFSMRRCWNNPSLPNHIENLIIEFSNVTILNIKFPLSNISRNITLDNLHRGRILDSGKLTDETENGQMLFYIEFCENQEIEILADSICIII